jgi:flagellar biosynthesis protein FlhG
MIDTGAGISDTVLEFLVAGGEILLVTTPEPTSITDSYSLLKALSRHPRYDKENTTIKMIANRVNKEEEGWNLFQKLNAVVERYLKMPISYLGSVPQDDKLLKAVMQQTPVSLQNPTAKSSQAYEVMAHKLMNKEEEAKQPRRGMAAFFSHIVNARRTM